MSLPKCPEIHGIGKLKSRLCALVDRVEFASSWGNSGHVVLTIKGKLKGLARGPSRAEFASSWETLGT